MKIYMIMNDQKISGNYISGILISEKSIPNDNLSPIYSFTKSTILVGSVAVLYASFVNYLAILYDNLI